MKHIIFRVDASFSIGMGHLMRSLVLAQNYAKKGAKITFSMAKSSQTTLVKEYGFGVVLLQSNNKKEFVKVIKKLHATMVVFDHYKINAKFEKYVKEKTGIKILSIDDKYQKHHCDILLNHNIHATASRYKKLVPPFCKIYCGERYTLLRQEFYQQKIDIFVAMGGSDTTGLNKKIIKALKKYKKKIQLHIVTTSANKNLKKLQKYSKKKKWVHLYVDSKNIATLIKKSEFAIITPSVIANEIIFMKKPFVAIQTMQNQNEMSRYFVKKNYPFLKKFGKKRLQKALKNYFGKRL